MSRLSQRCRQKLPSSRKRPRLLDLIDDFYGDWVEPVPPKFFSIPRKDMADLEKKLGVSLDATGKQVIEHACATFVNAVVLDTCGVSKSHLAAYACALSRVSMDLEDLLVRPNEYEAVRALVLRNWEIAGLSHRQNDVLMLAESVKLLAAEVQRVSDDHRPVKNGLKDLAFTEFTMHFPFIAKQAGASMKLPSNKYDGRSTPLWDFAVCFLQQAIEQGIRGIDSMTASELTRERCRTALRRYLAKVPRMSEYLRAAKAVLGLST